jgi:hypothetical protein
VRDLLELYKKLTPPSRCVVFDANTEEAEETLTDNDRERLIVIDKFLNICRDYINIDVVRESLRKNMCEGCGKSLGSVSVDDDWLQQCPHCGLEKYVLSNMVVRDGSASARNEYNDITNFVKALHRYQGLQAPKFPSDMEARLDAYFTAHHRPLGSEIRKLPMNERGRRGDTDHKMLFTALAATGLSDFYDDANLIGSTYWGWSLPDVRHLEPLILDHYRATQEVYVRLPKTRSSSLGTQFRLYRHLVLVGYVCYLSEFKVSNSDSSVDEHEALWKAMCEGANRPDIYYIPMVWNFGSREAKSLLLEMRAPADRIPAMRLPREMQEKEEDPDDVTDWDSESSSGWEGRSDQDEGDRRWEDENPAGEDHRLMSDKKKPREVKLTK